eukprot:364952-Chlamydomonas_euryale.AAC.13
MAPMWQARMTKLSNDVPVSAPSHDPDQPGWQHALALPRATGTAGAFTPESGVQPVGGTSDAPALPEAFVTRCRQQLVQLFDNVPTVATDPRRRQAFTSLPFAAVREWAVSDQLSTTSGNDVVYVLTVWIRVPQAASAPCRGLQLYELACILRVCTCGWSYLKCVLPNLDWFTSHRGLLKLASLSHAAQCAG